MKTIRRIAVAAVVLGAALAVHAVGAAPAAADPIGVAGEGELPTPNVLASVNTQVEGGVSAGPVRTYLTSTLKADLDVDPEF